MRRFLLAVLMCVWGLPSWATDAAEQSQRLYVAYYGRPADPAGLDYWAGRLHAAGGNWTPGIVAAFGTSAEFTARFAALAPPDLVNYLYRQLFNRNAEPAGLAF